jgi:hypothetical protein
MLRLLLLLTACASSVLSLSCICGSFPCQTPVCCPSGMYTPDECGCCLTCAKDEGESCGGPFQISGTCSRNLRCLRQCECKTKGNKHCVFPFKYQGTTHNSCTDVGSENGATWCATEVDDDGEVVRNTWEDCDEGCPGTDFVCNEGFLFNINGECVNATVAPSALSRTRPLASKLDDIPTSQKVAPFCPVGKSAAQMKGCKCAGGPVTKGLDGNPRGGCIRPLADHGIEELEEGWCFLENVQDAANPTQDCYEDTEFSVADGKFWSGQACQAEKNSPRECLSVSGKSCIFPFTYSGITHNSCTLAGSANAASWCATEVDEAGEVVRNTWEDCDLACPTEETIDE